MYTVLVKTVVYSIEKEITIIRKTYAASIYLWNQTVQLLYIEQSQRTEEYMNTWRNDGMNKTIFGKESEHFFH